MTTIHLATYTSRNFSFDCAGSTADEARAGLVAALDLHAHEYQCAPDWYNPEDIDVHEMTLGAGRRDRQTL